MRKWGTRGCGKGVLDEWQLVPETLNAVKCSPMPAHDAGGYCSLVQSGGHRLADLARDRAAGPCADVRSHREGIEGRVETATWLDRLLDGKFRSAAASTDVVRTTLTVRDYVHRALCSGFPEPALHLDERSRERWLGAYVDQLVTRDAEGVEEGCDPERLRRHLHALALNSAGVVDDVSLYEAARINKKTAKAYERLLRNLLLVDHHLRAEDGRREIDLVLEVGHNKVIGIEIKSSASPTNDEASHLRWFRDRFGDLVLATVLFHTGPE